MKQSQLFTKTTKESPKDETAINAQLLERAGFVQKAMAGVYSYLPLGIRVLQKIEQIVREEMMRVDGQEIFLPALHPKENWMKTGRWDTLDALFKITSRYDFEYALGPTHEEMVVPMAKRFIQSYRDLPFSVFQIQTKFRDEPRAKSGLLRGREFRMKDMYSYHATPKSLDEYYDRVIIAYRRVFERLGLNAMLTEASGGTFSKYSHEFQVETPTGEDLIYYCAACNYAVNKEIAEDGKCSKCGVAGKALQASEVGNIFKLNTKYSEPFDLTFVDECGEKHTVIMGCYGIGTSRIMGAIVDTHNDSDGIIWPEAVAPYRAHVVALFGKDEEVNANIRKSAEDMYLMLEGVFRVGNVLYDERMNISAGEKLKDSDLIGIPHRIIVSEKLVSSERYEYKNRSATEVKILTSHGLLEQLGFTPSTDCF